MKYFCNCTTEMGPRGLAKGNTQLTRQNYSNLIKLVHCLTRDTLRCNSLVQKICMFLQKETSHCKNSLPLGPQGPKQAFLLAFLPKSSVFMYFFLLILENI